MISYRSICALGACLFGAASLALAGETAAIVAPEAALNKLQDGNKRYAAAKVTDGKATADRRAETAQAQHPFAIIVGCADSRTSPEIVFDQNLGDLFVVRTAGNLVAEHALGSLEYAVEHLHVRLIVVMGHERCGAVKAALASPTAPGNVGSLVRDIQPAVQAAKGKEGDAIDNTIAENAKLVAAKIRKEAKFGDLAAEVKVVPAVYDLDTGVVTWIKE